MLNAWIMRRHAKPSRMCGQENLGRWWEIYTFILGINQCILGMGGGKGGGIFWWFGQTHIIVPCPIIVVVFSCVNWNQKFIFRYNPLRKIISHATWNTEYYNHFHQSICSSNIFCTYDICVHVYLIKHYFSLNVPPPLEFVQIWVPFPQNHTPIMISKWSLNHNCCRDHIYVALTHETWKKTQKKLKLWI